MVYHVFIILKKIFGFNLKNALSNHKHGEKLMKLTCSNKQQLQGCVLLHNIDIKI